MKTLNQFALYGCLFGGGCKVLYFNWCLLHVLLVGIRFQNTVFLTAWQRIINQESADVCVLIIIEEKKHDKVRSHSLLFSHYYVKILCIYGIINTCRLNFKFYIIRIKLGTFLLYPQKIRAINTDECSEF